MSEKKPSEYRKGRKNLIFAILISIPGPLLLAIGMKSGTSATQTADLLRRSCDLLSIFLAYLVFEITTRYLLDDEGKKSRLETYVKYFTGFSMCFSGTVMIYIAIASFGTEKGSIITSLILAIIGAVIDAKLYFNYRTMQNAVLSVQAKLHRAKMFLDCSMVLILSIWVLSPFDTVKNYADIIGSCSISIYLIWNGIRMVFGYKKEEDTTKKINEGYCAELFEVGEGKLLKLYKDGWSEAQVRGEYEITKEANALGIPSPCVYEFIEQNGRYGLVMDKLDSVTMLQIIQKRPFRAISLAKQMAKLHYDIHSLVPAQSLIPPQKDVYTKAIEDCAGLSESEKDNLMQLLAELSSEEKQSVCHGDFHAMNIMLSQSGVGIIDWAFTTLGDPCADVAGTYMITKLLAATSGGHNAFESFLFNLFTPTFANIYLKEYLKISGRSREEILKWIPIRAATYVDLGLPEQTNQKLYEIAKTIQGE